MDANELGTLIARGESEHVEFKRTTGELKEGMQTLCAFLNGPRPGVVLFGVGDGGRLVGQAVSTRTLEALANELRKIDPPATVAVDTLDLDEGKSVIAVRAPGGTGLYAYDGRAYHRVGPTTSVMPRFLYTRKLLEEVHATRRWELEPAVEGVAIADLDETEILRTGRVMRRGQPARRSPTRSATGTTPATAARSPSRSTTTGSRSPTPGSCTSV